MAEELNEAFLSTYFYCQAIRYYYCDLYLRPIFFQKSCFLHFWNVAIFLNFPLARRLKDLCLWVYLYLSKFSSQFKYYFLRDTLFHSSLKTTVSTLFIKAKQGVPIIWCNYFIQLFLFICLFSRNSSSKWASLWCSLLFIKNLK
jgi:hypothetical protein